MDYFKRIQTSAVLGAAGKMGSGITLLMAQEMIEQSFKGNGKPGDYKLYAVDVSLDALEGLKKYVYKQSAKKATKKADKFRGKSDEFKDLDDEALGKAYADMVLSVLQPTTAVEDAAGSGLVFEAVSENLDLKVKLFKKIEEASGGDDTWYFTNTSSVPIHLMDEKAHLGGRILGFHFYNPPAVQRLVELILTSYTKPELREVALELARNMGKIIVPANDHAGFIGNGHFMRDALHGISESEKLAVDMPMHEAIYMINTVSNKFLVRPMGIFQLIDYVGIDVVKFILGVMDPYYPSETLHSPLLDEMVGKGITGGQHHDGSQKDGFLRYAEGRPVAVFNPSLDDYVEISEFKGSCDEHLGPLPENFVKWKDIIRDPEKEQKLADYFEALGKMENQGAIIAKRYIQRSREIGLQLIRDGIALSEKDVNTVLLTGFFHAYGPINSYLK